jgi:hypothetical protein
MVDGMVSGLVSLDLTWQGFLTLLFMIFGLFMILAGAFTAYFGSGKSRTIGVGLLVLGLVVGIGFAYWYHLTATNMGFVGLGTLVYAGFLFLIAAVVGALLAIGIFLVAIMKS